MRTAVARAAGALRGRAWITLSITIAAATTVLTLATAGLQDPPAVAARAGGSTCGPGVDLLGFSDALNKQTFEGTNVGGLSGLTYDASRGVYYGLVDNDGTTPARFYTFSLPTGDGALGEPEILDVTTLRDAQGNPFTGANLDGEGITLTRDGELLISSETEPSIRRFALDGAFLGELQVPERFRLQKQSNQTFESLSLSPNGRSLFTANEGYLTGDGETANGSDRIRILRYEDGGAGSFEPADQYYYLADPGLGVVDIAALSENKLLVLERGFVSGQGNTVRIYEVSLAGARDVSGEESLATTTVPPLEKELLVDLANCPPDGATTPGTQANPLLDNYESLALGPRLPGGRRSLLLQSDDNFSSGQVTRVIALGVNNRQLVMGR